MSPNTDFGQWQLIFLDKFIDLAKTRAVRWLVAIMLN